MNLIEHGVKWATLGVPKLPVLLHFTLVVAFEYYSSVEHIAIIQA